MTLPTNERLEKVAQEVEEIGQVVDEALARNLFHIAAEIRGWRAPEPAPPDSPSNPWAIQGSKTRDAGTLVGGSKAGKTMLGPDSSAQSPTDWPGQFRGVCMHHIDAAKVAGNQGTWAESTPDLWNIRRTVRRVQELAEASGHLTQSGEIVLAMNFMTHLAVKQSPEIAQYLDGRRHPYMKEPPYSLPIDPDAPLSALYGLEVVILDRVHSTMNGAEWKPIGLADGEALAFWGPRTVQRRFEAAAGSAVLIVNIASSAAMGETRRAWLEARAAAKLEPGATLTSRHLIELGREVAEKAKAEGRPLFGENRQ